MVNRFMVWLFVDNEVNLKYNKALKNVLFVRWDAQGHARPLAFRYTQKKEDT